MYLTSKPFKSVFSLFLSLVIIGCGGSLTNGVALTGVAATGVALSNAAVFIKDADGKEPAGQDEAAGVAVVSTDANGAFTFSASLMSGLKSPILIKVTGKTVLDNGDDAFTSLHSIATLDGDRINVTPLTDVATTLALAADPAASFSSPAAALSSLSAAASSSASSAVMASLGQTDSTLATLNVFKADLDPLPTNDLTNPSAGKLHDMLLDSLVMVKSGNTVGLVDRNAPAEEYVNQPAISLAIGSTSLANVNGAISDLDPTNVLNATKLSAFVDRLNAAFASKTCDFSKAVDDCSAVVSDNTIFSTAYKHQGMPGDVWLKKWVGEALAIEDFANLNVSVKTAYAGSWSIGGKQVVRVLLQWQSGDTSNFVYRSMLLVDEDPASETSNVVAYGNQRDYFTWVKPTTVFNPDADNTYPYYPKYENGFAMVAGHWYAGHKDVVEGARFSGPGLPATRATSVQNADGDWINPNGISSGVEVFDLREEWGCSLLSLDPSVYVEKNTNTTNWNVAYTTGNAYDGSFRYRPGNQTCDSKFDFLRYYGVTSEGGKVTKMPSDFIPPKRGDIYTVVLYLNKARVDSLGLTLPTGYGTTTVQKPNGSTVEVYTISTTSKLQANPIVWGQDGLPSTMFAGITDETRARLVSDGVRDARIIDWTRNFVKLQEGTDANGNPIYARFVNFSAGIFESSYDQMRSVDSYSGAASNVPNINGVETGFQPYYQLLGANWGNETKPGLCGTTVGTFRGADLKVYVVSRLIANTTGSFASASCPALDSLEKDGSNNFRRYGNASNLYSDGTYFYNFYVARMRVKFSLDRWEFINATQKTRTISSASIVGGERVNATALCSVRKGFWSYRHAMVQLIDINGRGLMEKRQVWSDFPDKVPSFTGTDGTVWTRSVDVTRPNMDSDDLFLEPLYLTSGAPADDLSPYGLTGYKGEKGFIAATQRKNAANECEDIPWAAQ
jgi:hypothetical protein